MARPKKITDEAILKAAREAFIELGPKATTVYIAKKAGVSEGSIFLRFGSKKELFLSAIGMNVPEWIEDIDEPFEGKVEDRLVEIGTKMIVLLMQVLPKIEMMKAEFPEKKFKRKSPPVVALCQLTRFFSNLADHGYATNRPEILARIFMGSIHHFAFSALKGMDMYCPCEKDDYVINVASIILNSMEKMDE